MNIHQIVEDRRDHLLRVFATEFPRLVEVESAEGLESLLTLLGEFAFADATVNQHGKRALNNTFIVSGSEGLPENASLWVRAGYNDYRPAYSAFIKSIYNLQLTKDDLKCYDVDHLLNRKRAGSSTALLRVEALPLGANRSWGHLEEWASTSNVAGNNRVRRLMSYIIAAKVAGLSPPSSLSDQSVREELADGLAKKLGLRRKEVRQGLNEMFDHIDRNLS